MKKPKFAAKKKDQQTTEKASLNLKKEIQINIVNNTLHSTIHYILQLSVQSEVEIPLWNLTSEESVWKEKKNNLQ